MLFVNLNRVARTEGFDQRRVYPRLCRQFDFVIFTARCQPNWPNQDWQLQVEAIPLQISYSRDQSQGVDSELLRDFFCLVFDSTRGTEGCGKRLRVANQAREGRGPTGNELREAARVRLSQINLAV